MKESFDLSDIINKFGKTDNNQMGAGDIGEEIAQYLCKELRDTEIPVSDIFKAAYYVMNELNKDYIIIRRKGRK